MQNEEAVYQTASSSSLFIPILSPSGLNLVSVAKHIYQLTVGIYNRVQKVILPVIVS